MFENAFRIENELLLFENYFDLKAISYNTLNVAQRLGIIYGR